jgi:hypothetical protein
MIWSIRPSARAISQQASANAVEVAVMAPVSEGKIVVNRVGTRPNG